MRERSRRGVEVFFLAAGDDDAGSGFGEPAGDRLADAPAAAGDQGDFSRQINGSGSCVTPWLRNCQMRRVSIARAAPMPSAATSWLNTAKRGSLVMPLT